jgi:hypothetical protein
MRTNIRKAAAIVVGALLTILLLAGCAAPTQPTRIESTIVQPSTISPAPTGVYGDAPPELAAAEDTLTRFLNALADGDYTTAASLYAGDYELLRGYNPSLGPEDHAALLGAACKANGFMCLRPAAMDVVGDNPGGLTFSVTFVNPDGSTFVFTPPPGAPGEPRSSFPMRVFTGPEGPRVLDLPPYVS